MKTIRSLQLMQYGGPDTVRIADLPAPVAGPAQVLVRVHAAGVNALDWKVREGYVKDAFPLPLPAVLGIELAGVVAQVGSDVSLFKVGDRVMGPLGGLGAYADLVAVDVDKLAVLPEGLSMVQAAALPVAAVSAWQSLHLAGPLVRLEQRQVQRTGRMALRELAGGTDIDVRVSLLLQGMSVCD